MREHFSSYQRTLKRFSEAEGDNVWLESCPIEMWEANVHYWKTLNANKESQCMRAICAPVQEPVVLG
jgi:hypothetical protein